MKKIQRHVFISGRVQGVGFRQSTKAEVLKRSGVKGWVRNLEDGRVEAVFCGPEDDVLKLVAWCGEGPLGSKVTRLEVLEERPDLDLPSFDILH